MSFLMAEGHAGARGYPLRFLWDEVRLARRRVNQVLASEALLLQLVVGSIFSKESGDVLRTAIEALNRG